MRVCPVKEMMNCFYIFSVNEDCLKKFNSFLREYKGRAEIVFDENEGTSMFSVSLPDNDKFLVRQDFYVMIGVDKDIKGYDKITYKKVHCDIFSSQWIRVLEL